MAKSDKSERSRTCGGSCLTWLAIVLTSLAFFVSLATLLSCEYVVHENDNPEIPDAEMRSAGIYCFDSSIIDSVKQFAVGGVRIFCQVVGTIAVVLGLIMVFMLWKTTRTVHGKCYHRTMGFFIMTCFICMFLTLTLQLSDFCLDYEGMNHNCDLGWGGYAAIASGCLYFLAGICLCKMPKYKEPEPEEEEVNAGEKDEEGVEVNLDDTKDMDEEAPKNET